MQLTILLVWHKQYYKSVLPEWCLFPVPKKKECYKNHKSNKTKQKIATNATTAVVAQHGQNFLGPSMFCILAHPTYYHHEWCSGIFLQDFYYFILTSS